MVFYNNNVNLNKQFGLVRVGFIGQTINAVIGKIIVRVIHDNKKNIYLFVLYG